MSRSFLCGFLLALAVAWLPGGLIHRGQQHANREAWPILVPDPCDPLLDWHACRRNWQQQSQQH